MFKKKHYTNSIASIFNLKFEFQLHRFKILSLKITCNMKLYLSNLLLI